LDRPACVFSDDYISGIGVPKLKTAVQENLSSHGCENFAVLSVFLENLYTYFIKKL